MLLFLPQRAHPHPGQTVSPLLRELLLRIVQTDLLARLRDPPGPPLRTHTPLMIRLRPLPPPQVLHRLHPHFLRLVRGRNHHHVPRISPVGAFLLLRMVLTQAQPRDLEVIQVMLRLRTVRRASLRLEILR